MKSSLVLCVVLGVVFSANAASVTYPEPSTLQTMTVASQVTITEGEGYNVTSDLLTSYTTTPYPTATSVTCCEPTSSLTTMTTTTQAPPSQSQMMCPDGWEVFLGHCYIFVNDGMTWPQAQSNCALLESMLVSVHSAQEYGFLQQLTQNQGYQDAWLGGFYLQDQWLWLDGSWFYNNSFSSMSQDSTNPCLVLNYYEAWSNSPCNVGDYPSICVQNSKVPLSMLCPEGWRGFQGRCYYYNDNSLTWQDADAYCTGLQASLVSVHSREEYFFLLAVGSSQTWLGGFYLEDQWMWLDGSWFYQGFFTQMSPDSTYPCLTIYNTDGWSNYSCDQAFSSFCVKNAEV